MIEKEATEFLAAGTTTATSTTTGSTIDLRAKHGTLLTGKITNGATAPSTPARFQVEISTDGVTFYRVLDALGPSTNNGERVFEWWLRPEVMRARVLIDNSAGNQDVTHEAEGHTIDTLI